jgi:hypothetical protein
MLVALTGTLQELTGLYIPKTHFIENFNEKILDIFNFLN